MRQLLSRLSTMWRRVAAAWPPNLAVVGFVMLLSGSLAMAYVVETWANVAFRPFPDDPDGDLLAPVLAAALAVLTFFGSLVIGGLGLLLGFYGSLRRRPASTGTSKASAQRVDPSSP
jgi:hypothetical protein